MFQEIYKPKELRKEDILALNTLIMPNKNDIPCEGRNCMQLSLKSWYFSYTLRHLSL